jgi:hypothetical protein
VRGVQLESASTVTWHVLRARAIAFWREEEEGYSSSSCIYVCYGCLSAAHLADSIHGLEVRDRKA